MAILKRLKTWQLIVLLLLASLLAGTFLRVNNLNMVERRRAVIAADKEGGQEDIKQSLVELQHYVSGHMNTDLGSGVSLIHSYQRDRAEAIRDARRANTPAGEAYREADRVCKQRFTGGASSFRQDYVQCVVNRTSNIGSEAAKADLPRPSLYRYDFVSPLWSFDLAGLFVAITLLLAALIVAKIVSTIVLDLMLRRRFRSV